MDFRVTRIHVLTINNTTSPFHRTEWSLQPPFSSQERLVKANLCTHLHSSPWISLNCILSSYHVMKENFDFHMEYEVKDKKKLRSSSQCYYCYNLIQEPAQEDKQFTPSKYVVVCTKSVDVHSPFFLKLLLHTTFPFVAFLNIYWDDEHRIHTDPAFRMRAIDLFHRPLHLRCWL